MHPQGQQHTSPPHPVTPPEPRSRRDGLEGYARIYPGLAVLGLFVSFLPLFQRVSEETGEIDPVPSTWELAAGHNGGRDVAGLLMLFVLIGLMVLVAFRPVPPIGVPIGIAGLGLVLVTMLLTKSGFSEPLPDLSAAGTFGVALGLGTIALGVAQAIHLLIGRRRA